MNCHDTRRLLGLFIDGELDGERAGELEEHLGDCESCRQEQSSLAGLAGVLRSEYHASPRDGLAERAFQAAMGSEPSPRSFFEALFPVAWPAAVATSMAALALVGWMLTSGPAISPVNADLYSGLLNTSSSEQVQGVLKGALGVDSSAQLLRGAE